MKTSNIICITTKEQYDSVRLSIEALIKEATRLNMLEPGADNEYIREIGRLAKMSAEYEDNYLEILPLRIKTPLIKCIENYYSENNLRRKEIAEILEINESVFSQIMNGKRKISISIAKKLYEKLNIDPKIILEYS